MTDLEAFVRDEKAVAEFLAYWQRTFRWDVEPAVPMMKAIALALDRDAKLAAVRAFEHANPNDATLGQLIDGLAYHGCVTGDCPDEHTTSDCARALVALINEFADDARKLLAPAPTPTPTEEPTP